MHNLDICLEVSRALFDEVSLPVLQPCASHVLVLLIYLQVDILEPLLCKLGEADAAGAATDMDDAQMSPRPIWLIQYPEAVSVGYRPAAFVALSHVSGKTFVVLGRCHVRFLSTAQSRSEQIWPADFYFADLCLDRGVMLINADLQEP